MTTKEQKKNPIPVKEVTDWTDKEQVISTFPFYVREKFAGARKKNMTNSVDIEFFTLKSPYGDKVLFKDTHFKLDANKRTCLFGGNGTGKTSLFKAIVSGRIKEFPTHIHAYHCKELEHMKKARSVLDTVLHSYPFLNTLKQCEAKLKGLLEKEPENKELKEMARFIDTQIRSINGDSAKKRASDMLRVLGFDEEGLKLSTNDLSGGLRMRVALAMAFFINPDLLLLDEPTNHLDFPSVLWLENRLRGYRGSFLLVTHDRDLLENVCTGVILLEEKKMVYYNTNFKAFEKKKAKEDEKKEAKIDKFIDRNRNADPSTQVGRTLHDMRTWQTNYLARMVAIQGKFTFPDAVKLKPVKDADPNEPISLINMKNVRFSYNGKVFIFNTPINVNITTESRLGIMGPNGAGKSTLLKLLTGKLKPTEGTVTTHPKFKLAYFGQHSTAELDMKTTPAEFMTSQFPKVKRGLLAAHLTKAGVIGDVQHTRMKNLSYSQRSCVIFAKLTFVSPHLLIMDEPTNFLDLASVDSLMNASNKFKGALLVVTHSRGFLKKCTKRYISVVPGKFEYYDSMKEAENATYSFIRELEDGGKVGADALAAGGGSMSSMASQVSAEKAAELKAKQAEKDAKADKGGYHDDSGAFVLTKKTGGMAVAKKKKKDANEGGWKVGDVGEALWTDGKYYMAEVKKVTDSGLLVTYTRYGNTARVPSRLFRARAKVVQKKPARNNKNQNRRNNNNSRGNQRNQQRNGGGNGNQRNRQQQQNRTSGGNTRQRQRQKPNQTNES